MAVSVGHLIKENHSRDLHFHTLVQIMNAPGAFINVVLDKLAGSGVISLQTRKAFYLFTRRIRYFGNERIEPSALVRMRW